MIQDKGPFKWDTKIALTILKQMSKLNQADQSRVQFVANFRFFGVGSCQVENRARDFKIGRRDDIENVNKTIGFVGKAKTLHVHRTFLYIYLSFLFDYDVKLPNFTFCKGRKQATTKFYFSF